MSTGSTRSTRVTAKVLVLALDGSSTLIDKSFPPQLVKLDAQDVPISSHASFYTYSRPSTHIDYSSSDTVAQPSY